MDSVVNDAASVAESTGLQRDSGDAEELGQEYQQN